MAFKFILETNNGGKETLKATFRENLNGQQR